MAFLVQQQQQVTMMMQTFTAAKKENLANARLDERSFRRIKEFANRREDWKEWEMHVASAVRECDTSFADYMWTLEKMEDEEVGIIQLGPTYTQLSAALYSRLIGVTTKEAFRIVEMIAGSVCEAWRLLSRRYDPQTDARLTSLIQAIVGHKIKGKDVQAGLVQWESQVLALE